MRCWCLTMKKKISTNEAWKQIITKYDILNQIDKNGFYRIKASTIKKFKEPRLMAKWDSSESLPPIFEKNKINILPDSRSSYILSDFLLYEKIPELTEHVTEMQRVEIPEYESIDVNNITSEANAINVLILSNILDDFLKEDGNVSTFNGRMGTGVFDFRVDTIRGYQNVSVHNAQCEIDGGFENDNSVVILEAKNVVYPDFHIRQLYYPYRLWNTKVKKPIRVVFSVYSNRIYRLFEYRFTDINNYSSIELVQEKNYSLQDTDINIDELIEVKRTTPITKDDNMDNIDIPFIQADSFERVISLLENLYDNPMTVSEVADLMQFQERQSNYYFNAGRYLGLFKKQKTEDKGVVIKLTTLGNSVYKLDYKERQLKLVSLILEHKIFAGLFEQIVSTGEFPKKEDVKVKMQKYNVCGKPQIDRRSTSVLSWLNWIFNLPRIS